MASINSLIDILGYFYVFFTLLPCIIIFSGYAKYLIAILSLSLQSCFSLNQCVKFLNWYGVGHYIHPHVMGFNKRKLFQVL